MTSSFSQKTTIYITKHALTTGIRKVDAMIDPATKWAKVKGDTPSWASDDYFAPSAYRLTEADAVADAKKRQAKRIASLNKQIARVQALDFDKAIG